MKFIAETGLFMDADENRRLWEFVDAGKSEIATVEAFGTLTDARNYSETHIEAVRAIPYVDRDAIAKRNFKIVLDAVNASGSFIHQRLLHALGVADVIALSCDGSGVFPHRPEPVPENLTTLKEAI